MGILESFVDEIQNHYAARQRELLAEREGCAAIYLDLDWAGSLADALGGPVAEMLDSATPRERCDELADQLLAEGMRQPEELTALGRALVDAVLGYRAQAARRQRASRVLTRRASRLEAALRRLEASPSAASLGN